MRMVALILLHRMTPMHPDFLEDLGHGVYAIDTGFVRPRYDAAYLVLSGEGRAAFIDTGTNHALPRHLAALDALGIAREAVDFVIPTHVHLDHAGGAGALMRELPAAALVVHPRGARHMIDPSALWQGALAVYGAEEMERSYGALVPVEAQRVRITHDGMDLMLGSRRLHFLDTPGHAKHQHGIWDEATRGWFTGDTFGLSLREFDVQGRAWIAPAIVPSQFEPQALHESVRRLLSFEPACIYLTHYGRIGPGEEVPRLGRAMLALMDEMAAIGQRCAQLPERHAVLKRELAALYGTSLASHGIEPVPAMMSLLAIDIELNAQGLAIWLDREAKENRT
jgi:glyoxylase-like metal-dependent hydrolase (beta-lactamase superfamily II)